MKKTIILITMLLVTYSSAYSKWWIFGKSKDEVIIKYMLINDISQDDAAGKITLFYENIKNLKIYVKGKAYPGKKSTIGLVRYTIDNKQSWNEAKFNENGDFEFDFNIEKDKKYVLCVEITNTLGKTNKVDESCKEIIISKESINLNIKSTLDELFKAYSEKNINKFMKLVSEDFVGDKDLLELALKKDFNTLDNISISYTINNIALGSKGIAVSITYSRSFISKKSGSIIQDRGMTEMVFKKEANNILLYSMKKPLLFGLSDTDNLASGTTAGQTESIIIDDIGEVTSGTQIITIYNCNSLAVYNFSSGNYICDMGMPNGDIWFYSWADAIGYSMPNEHKEINKPLSLITPTEAKNNTGFSSNASVNPASLGKSYIFKISNGYWGIELLEMPYQTYGGMQFKIKFKVKKF
ncbi:MAG: hypothetical protein N2Z20_02725 [Elusimicrobiales bacterium]|nr:hypothetical protein [Elusimicrobiales bacterium]